MVAARSCGQPVALDQAGGEPGDRVLRLPVGELGQLAVLGRIALVVAAQSVDQGLDERRPVAGARPGDRLADRRVDREDVVAVDRHGRDAVDAGVVGEVLHLRVGGERRELGVAVVLAEEHDRQPPEARDVQGLVEGAGLAGPVAEEDDRHAIRRFQRGGPGVTQREWQIARDDPGRRHEARPRGPRYASSRPCRRSSRSSARRVRPSRRTGSAPLASACACAR